MQPFIIMQPLPMGLSKLSVAIDKCDLGIEVKVLCIVMPCFVGHLVKTQSVQTYRIKTVVAS